MNLRTADWVAFVVLATVWGGSFLLFKILDDAGLPSLTIVFARVLLAAIALLVVMRVRGAALPADRTSWRDFAVMGVLNNIAPYALLVWAETLIPSGTAAILNATTPIFAVIVNGLVLRIEPLRAATLAGIALGFGGVVELVGPAALAHLAIASLAQLACLGAGVSYAFAGAYGRRLRARGIDPLASATGQLCASSIVLMPLTVLVDRPWTLPLPSFGMWVALVLLALVCTAFAYILYFSILQSAGSTNALLVTMLIPVSALALGALFLGETIDTRAIAGTVLIATGLIAVDGRAFVAVKTVWIRLRLRTAHRG
jgi:drug/metabolite transporter (DMT)-like permease